MAPKEGFICIPLLNVIQSQFQFSHIRPIRLPEPSDITLECFLRTVRILPIYGFEVPVEQNINKLLFKEEANN